MNKRVIIISASIVLLLVISILSSYLITKNSGLKNNIDEISENKLVEVEKSADTNISENEYKTVSIESQLANELYKFVPKYLANTTDKMTNEYIIYAAICRLEETQSQTSTYLINEEELDGYKFDAVQKVARQMYGDTIAVEKKDTYNLPIGYSSKDDVFYKYAMGFGSTEESQVLKELKENDKTYKLTVYAISIEYDINDLTHIYISTKNTYKLYKNGETDTDVIKKSMKEFTIEGIDIDTAVIVNEYKNDLPLIEYELEKLDDRGTKYFVKDIKLIFN